jgi:acyl-CoA synthetase (NDP forming)
VTELKGYLENRTQLFGRKELDRLINPSSIAIIGASETAGSFGARTMENLASFRGKLFPINPKRDQILGHKAYQSVEAIPGVPDVAIISVPQEQVIDLVKRCADKGIGGAIVYSSGFAELGIEARIAAQRQLAEIAASTGMRIIGPNCVGIINFASTTGMHFMPKFNEMPMVSGGIGLVSQSGGLGYTIIQSLQRGIGFSHFLSAGNSCDVDICDLIDYLVDDDATKVIACLFEGIRDGGRLIEAGRRALAAKKPLIIYKMGRSDISKKAALSHTGTLAGSNTAYEAAFREIGAVVVDNWEEVLETACLFERAGVPKGTGAGVMASSGGAAVISGDKAEEFGVAMPAPQAETIAKLTKLVPDFGSVANPTDMTAETLKSFDLYSACIRAFADDPGYGVVVVPMLSAQKPITTERARHLDHLADNLGKPICLVWFNEWLEGPGSEVYDKSRRISMFRSMARCMKAIRAWLDYHDRRAKLLVSDRKRLTSVVCKERALAGLATASTRSVLSESQSKKLLKIYGITANREVLAQSEDEAVAGAERIGFPVVLKADSPDIPHKTEAGVVRLDLNDAAAVRQAYAEIKAALERQPSTVTINGIVVQEMVKAPIEMMIGASVDIQFGPMITCGFGGTAVEIVRDIQTRRAPVSESQALEMIQALRGNKLLSGYRNTAPANVEALAQVVCRASELISDLHDQIAELDINPVKVSAATAVAVDALIVLCEKKDK